eukprot:Gb_26526 [translate_table: standard]
MAMGVAPTLPPAQHQYSLSNFKVHIISAQQWSYNKSSSRISFDSVKVDDNDKGIIRSSNAADSKVATVKPNGDMDSLCKEGRLKEALNLLYGMEQVSFNTYCSLLQICSNMKALAEGKKVHAHMAQDGSDQNNFLCTKLVVMYIKCGSVVDARLVFDKAKNPNVFTWTAIIGGYSIHGFYEETLALFYRMLHAGVHPDNFVFPSVLKACAGLASIPQGKQIHAYVMRNGFQSDFFIGSALVAMYAKCGFLDNARQVFDKMPQRSVTLWNSMIAGYVQNGHDDEALKLFFEMQSTGMKPDSFTLGSISAACANFLGLKQGKEIHGYVIRSGFKSDVFVGSALVNMYAKSGNIEYARLVFDKISQRDAVLWSSMIAGYAQSGHGDEALQLFREMKLHGLQPNLIIWNAVVAGYVQNGNGDEALKLFCQMQVAGIKPNPVTITSILPVYANLAGLGKGQVIHAYIVRNGFQLDVFVCSALVDMYSKCGSVNDARRVFDNISKRDVVLWNVMIAGYAMHGQGKDALALFNQMQEMGMKPNNITFTGVLCACSHTGLVDEGWQHFDCMVQFHHITPSLEHYTCMVDLLGRAGRLEEAHAFIHSMPLIPDAGVWGALLGACRIHCNVALGEIVAEHLFELEPENAGSYVLLSNIYAVAGRWDDVAKIRKMMKDRRLRKSPGCSWVEVKNRVNAFLVGDRSHPQTEKIYGMLETLAGQIKKAGYVSDTNFALQDVEEEEKEHALWHHSEKLAIAFGLINTSHGTPIRIMKNLRMCGDCHTAIKFISNTEGREIFVRDTNRFHHFKDGLCSCRDYW